jgi:hypothetical protein
MNTGTRILCGIVGGLLIAMAAMLVFFAASAAFGSYYENPATILGVIPGPLFTMGRHLVARCSRDYERRPLVVTIGDYLGDTLVAMALISALDGVWASDASASDGATMLLLAGVAVYVFSRYLSRSRRTSGE